MNKNKHAPGPWRFGSTITTLNGDPIATVHDQKANVADAQLIAASPLMLDALKECLKAIGMQEHQKALTICFLAIQESEIKTTKCVKCGVECRFNFYNYCEELVCEDCFKK